MYKKKYWIALSSHSNNYLLGDQAPSGTYRIIADFLPRHCENGHGDETPTEQEAHENLLLAIKAPDLLDAVVQLINCPDLNKEGLDAVTWTAINTATRIVAEIDHSLLETPATTPLEALKAAVKWVELVPQLSGDQKETYDRDLAKIKATIAKEEEDQDE